MSEVTGSQGVSKIRKSEIFWMPDHGILRKICPKLRIREFCQPRSVLWSTVLRDVISQDPKNLNAIIKTYLMCAEIVCRVRISLQQVEKAILVLRHMTIYPDPGPDVLRILGFHRARSVLWSIVLRDMIS